MFLTLWRLFLEFNNPPPPRTAINEDKKMKKQDALAKLAALEAETKALREIIEKPDSQPTRWRPRDGERYFHLAYDGAVYPNINTFKDNKSYAYGNCFPCRDLAQKASTLMARANKIIAAALQVDPDAGCRSISRMYSVTFYFGSGWDGFNSCDSGASASNVFVHTLQQAKAMAAILNAEGV
jgi:hypothetical protein